MSHPNGLLRTRVAFMIQTAGPIEQTLFIVKPDAQPVANLILARLLSDGFDLVHLSRCVPLPGMVWEQHYAEHKGKPFYAALIAFQMSGPVTVARLERPDAVARLRAALGPTNLQDAPPGTIRAEWRGFSTGAPSSTIAHASDSLQSARREILYWQTILGWRV